MTTTTTTASGCPAWCPQSEAGHRWTIDEAGIPEMERTHTLPIGTIDLRECGEQRVSIDVHELLNTDTGEHTVAGLAVTIEPLGLHLSPAEASMFASLIEDAATRGFSLLGVGTQVWPDPDEDGEGPRSARTPGSEA